MPPDPKTYRGGWLGNKAFAFLRQALFYVSSIILDEIKANLASSDSPKPMLYFFGAEVHNSSITISESFCWYRCRYRAIVVERSLTLGIQKVAISRTLRVLTLSTTIALFALIVYGGVVRLTDSGLGCPDWPLCHGSVIPSTDSATLIEYFHRLFASITGVMVLAAAVIVWRNYRLERYLLTSVMLALFLLVIQIILGAVTVRTGLEPGLVMAHLAVAEAILGCMILATLLVWRDVLQGSLNTRKAVEANRGLFLVFVAVIGTFILLIAGAYVQASEATGACGDSWPLCQGELLPDGRLPLIHMLHRLLSLLTGGLVLVALAAAWLFRDRHPWMKQVIVLVGSLFLAQILVGALNVTMGFPLSINVLHLAMGTAVWASLVVFVVLMYPLPSSETEPSNAT